MNRWTRSAYLSVSVLVLLAGAPASGQTLIKMYQLIELNVDGATQTRAYALNDTGQVIGWGEFAAGRRAVHWHNFTSTDLHGTVHFDLAHPYTPTLLFDGEYSEAYDISNADQIVGTARTNVKCPDGNLLVSLGYLLRPAVLTDLASPYPGDALTDLAAFCGPCQGAPDSAAIGVSNANHIVGWADTPDMTIRAFIVTPPWYAMSACLGNDRLQDLGTLRASDPVSSATSVNDAGHVTGYSYTVLTDGRAAYRGFLVVPIDNNGDGLGDVWSLAGADGVNPLMADIGTLGGLNSWGRAINNAGQIVGESDVRTPAGAHLTHAFLWQNGVMLDLGTLWADRVTGFSAASAVNEAGTVVGWAENEQRQRRAFVYEDGQMRDLNTLIYPLDAGGNIVVSGVTLTEARDINADGVIVGWGSVRGSAGQTRGFLLVPMLVDPATLVAAGADPNSIVSGTGPWGANGGYTGAPLFGAPSHVAAGGAHDPNNPLAPTGAGLCGFGVVPAMAVTLLGLGGVRLARRR